MFNSADVIQCALIILYELCHHSYCVVVYLWCLYLMGTDTHDEELQLRDAQKVVTGVFFRYLFIQGNCVVEHVLKSVTLGSRNYRLIYVCEV